ncbi:MAG: phosphotransferase family protein [Alphaproteobacteria bacterium HGW-Alphaproteobacteria-12]|nr:MAG: phosphotransferase family protein [Alphaproteobacteria bacterium HGW-Alphaproteobacteria-12]
MNDAAESRQDQFSGTKVVADSHKFDEKRLEDYMQAHVDGFKGPITVKQFKGGQSNPTYQIVTPAKKYVLRRKPPGKLLPSAHAVDREYKVITALHGVGFPAPRTYCLCDDDSVIGTMFYIMDMVEGRVLWEPLLPNQDKETRTKIYASLNETLAQLHMVDYEKIGLGDFGKPGNYFMRQISRWSKQYVASQTENIPEMNKLMEWLPENVPQDSSTSIVHGDYRLDNTVLHPTEPKVIAVLDWELSTLGHPLGDFTYSLMQWVMPGQGTGGGTGSIQTADLKSLGIPTLEDYIAMYCDRTNRPNGIENLDFYFSYNFFRLAGILQGIAGRVRDGTASSEHAKTMAANVRPLAQEAWVYAQRAGAK